MPVIDLGFCWPGETALTPPDGLALLRTAGFDGVEFWPHALEIADATTWSSLLRDAGMKCVQLCPYFNFVSGAEKLAASRRIFDTYIEHAQVLDCKRLRVFTGPPWGEGVVGASEASEQQWQSAIDGLTEYCNVAAPLGIELCLECHGGSLMEDSPSALRLLRSVNRANLTVNLQIPFKGEPWQSSVNALGPYTTHIHIHNWVGVADESDLTFLGEGTFIWEPVVQQLCREYGKSVCLSVEHVDHGGRHDPWETARRDGPFLTHLRANVLSSS